jgi:ABC-type Fe3+ transport system permease subunit
VDLAFAYGITVLPFAYRSIQASIDAVDLRTLAEAAPLARRGLARCRRPGLSRTSDRGLAASLSPSPSSSASSRSRRC